MTTTNLIVLLTLEPISFLYFNSYRLHQKELDRIKDPEKRHRRLCELNVIEQCINVYKTGVVQRKRVETYQAGQEFTTPRIHGLVFDPRVGRLKRLNVRHLSLQVNFV